ncbi:maleylpyruvate isomerase family mycothiol-dependent enzyme [Cellulomonas composti]|uniref:Mycothiol-dependent maleylpyruvate isomerase metal-binding domain-containing protein n=1 Tax=Cellulomonas composti TaxID=266130 RepID=A0A511JDY8_9CELL|nr:maleylpyruvate isomerase family mycothiol-dependent enzyme [Cellulomonas composti]GEL96195.1 hypothetical protein CCO02nite_28530 [Cellulomonas composti]
MTQAAPHALDHLAALTSTQATFLSSIGEVDPVTPIPWCGRWRVRHLVEHLGRVHHWAAAQAAKQHETPLGRGPFVLDEFYATYAAEVRDALARLGDREAWTLVGTGPASWWRRRQLHETLVHLWDLRASSGLDVVAAPEVWSDTVDEVVTVMQPRQVALGRMEPLPFTVALRASDTDRTWVLGTASGAAADDADDAVADDEPLVAVTGPARELALLLWGRLTPDADELRITGEQDALDRALAEHLTP